jgi:hypothetical protein
VPTPFWSSRSLEIISTDEKSPVARVASVMDFFHARAPHVVRLLRLWLKNINHQTEPALTHLGEFFSALGALF